jgi:putative transposase
MPKELRRRFGLGHHHFITCSCHGRLPLFASARAKNLFVKIPGEGRESHGFALAGYAVMPNHIHLLINEPAKGAPSNVMQVLKQQVSRRLRRNPRKTMFCPQLRLPLRQSHDFLPQFWQPRFYDFNVWSPTKFVEKLHYIHTNPVKRKRVAHPRHWPWSSFSFYAKKDSGLVRSDPMC